MWTRTLSTTISTNPSSMGRLSHGAGAWTPAPTEQPDGQPHRGAEHEPADVGEERDAALRGRGGHAERADAVDQLEDEPGREHKDRRDIDELDRKSTRL